MHLGAPAIAETPVRIELPDAGATAALGRRLAARVRPGDVVALWGELGAGKTALARALIQALPMPDGTPGEEAVPSPTFTLVQTYDRRPAPVYHADLYRIGEPEEVVELGWDEALAEGILLVEWPGHAGAFLPAARLDVQLDHAPDGGRTAALSDREGAWMDRLAELAADA